jgi:DNA-directed RNA polymerase alpha subunit
VLELSVRGYHSLKRAQICVVADLIECSFDDLLEIKHINQKTATMICQNLEKKMGLSLLS